MHNVYSTICVMVLFLKKALICSVDGLDYFWMLSSLASDLLKDDKLICVYANCLILQLRNLAK